MGAGGPSRAWPRDHGGGARRKNVSHSRSKTGKKIQSHAETRAYSARKNHKVCRKCTAQKPLDEFPIRERSADGHGSWCLACHREATALWRRRQVSREEDQGLTSGQQWELLSRKCGLCQVSEGQIRADNGSVCPIERPASRAIQRRPQRTAWWVPRTAWASANRSAASAVSPPCRFGQSLSSDACCLSRVRRDIGSSRGRPAARRCLARRPACRRRAGPGARRRRRRRRRDRRP